MHHPRHLELIQSGQPGHREMTISDISTTGDCWSLQISQLQTRQDVFILEKKMARREAVSLPIKKTSFRARWKGGGGKGKGGSRPVSRRE